MPFRSAGYPLGLLSPYPLPPPSVYAHRDSAACLRSVEFWSQYGKLVGFCVLLWVGAIGTSRVMVRVYFPFRAMFLVRFGGVFGLYFGAFLVRIAAGFRGAFPVGCAWCVLRCRFVMIFRNVFSVSRLLLPLLRGGGGCCRCCCSRRCCLWSRRCHRRRRRRRSCRWRRALYVLMGGGCGCCVAVGGCGCGACVCVCVCLCVRVCACA